VAFDFSGRRIVITGAGRGIGRATARAFAEAGADLVLLGRSEATLEEVQRELGRLGGSIAVKVCDVSRKTAVDAALDSILRRRKRIDVLVNNAGISGDAGPFLTLGEDAWDEMLAVNLKGPFLVSQRVAAAMAEVGGGVILNNASIAGLGVDGPFSHYSASKAGLIALTRSMAVELAPFGIRVNSVSPGYTRTDMTTQYFGPEADEFLSKNFVRAPIRRIVEAGEIAAAFLFLASDLASGITGANLIVDGGLTSNLFIMETFPDNQGSA
jgi:NAD(P)-dependent dehydrogenase (short-subunit alcohol dehydrogenase family)